MKKTLWSHDFIIITLGTLISAIGSTAMSFALSLVVFDHTSSTLMTGIFTAISLMPTVLIPILAAPLVDGCCRKRLIVMLDSGNGILYLLFAAFLLMQEFSYAGYLIFSLLTASFGAIYSLAYSSLYPDLIPKGFAQRGYSVSSLIYPSVTALFTPVASLLYVHLGIAWICAMEGILLLTAALFEARIRYQETIGKRVFTLQKYKGDLMDGFRYLKKEKGIRSIYGYMAVTNASAEGINLVTMAMFQSSPILTTTMYAFLTTADTIGRMAGGLMHYVLHIPAKKRYRVAVSVYAVYESLDMVFLFLPYPLMVVNRFTCGFLGINSLNIREASTQNYLPSHMRARVNALFQVLVALIMMASRFSAGVIAQYVSYPLTALLFASFSMLAIFLLIIRNRKQVSKIYDQEL